MGAMDQLRPALAPEMLFPRGFLELHLQTDIASSLPKGEKFSHVYTILNHPLRQADLRYQILQLPY